MNRWPNGDRLTREDLLKIASDTGVDMPKLRNKIEGYGENMAMSYLRQATAEARFDMMGRRELVLKTEVWGPADMSEQFARERASAREWLEARCAS